MANKLIKTQELVKRIIEITHNSATRHGLDEEREAALFVDVCESIGVSSEVEKLSS